jgi:hypothetical protein
MSLCRPPRDPGRGVWHWNLIRNSGLSGSRRLEEIAMDTLLVIVTLVSLALALGMSVICWHLVREERRRSAARLEALDFDDGAAGIGGSGATGWQDSPLNGASPRGPAEPGYRAARAPVAAGQMARAGAEPAAELPLRRGPDELFSSTQDRETDGGRRFAVLAAVALVMFAGLGGGYLLLGGRSAGGPGAAAAHQQPAAEAPLDLLSLRHGRNGQDLVISGLVRNPRAGAPLLRVSAVAFLLDRNGAFLSSVRAPLDFTALRPGDESPFVITVPAASAAPVARYRISFRTEQGEVLAHVDRRNNGGVEGARP